MDFNFKVPSTIPQDLLLIQDLIGSFVPPTARLPDALDSSDDSIASSDEDVESEDEVEADLVPHEEDNDISTAVFDSGLHSDSDLDSSSSAESEDGPVPADDVEDEESGMMIPSSGYLQTKNEIIDTNIMVPIVSEIEPCDKLEKVGEIISIVGDIVIVRGIPLDDVRSLAERALDVESLLVFEDRKVLGHIYETFGPTSQPLYQVKFNQHYPLHPDKVWLSREVFHVPQRSHFVFVDQLKKLRGSDASNIHDEEPAEDEIEFSDDEKEAAFKAERKHRRGRSASFSKQFAPGPSRICADDVAEDTYCGSNPYDAHGPYDDDYHVTRSLRPSPIPYDDPYADVPTSDTSVPSTEIDNEFGRGSSCESGEVGYKVSRGRMFRRGTRGRGDRNHQPRSNSRRDYQHNPVTAQRTFELDTHQSLSGMTTSSRMAECATGPQVTDGMAPYPFVQPSSNAWFPPEASNIPNYAQQPFIQPHINPRFASAFGLGLPSPVGMVPHAPQNPYDPSRPHNWVSTWTTQHSAGSEREEESYGPL